MLRASELTWELVARGCCPPPERISIKAASSTFLPRPAANDWIAAGDAAAAFDPLSSHGIGSAVAGGTQAASAVSAALDGDDGAFTRYTDRLRADYARYLWLRHAYYQEEQRWLDSPFWSRRHTGFGVRSNPAPDLKASVG